MKAQSFAYASGSMPKIIAEPGWMLEIDREKSIALLADYGEKKVTTPA